MVHPELALEVVKTRRSDLKDFIRHCETVHVDDLSLVIGSTPEILTRIQEVFGDANKIRHVKLNGKFFFAAVDLAKIALWNGDQTPSNANIAHYVTRTSAADKELNAALGRVHQFG